MPHHSALLVIYADVLRELPANDLALALGETTAPHVINEGLIAAKDVLTSRVEAPKYIAIDIGGRGPEVFDELDILAHACEPGVQVVVTGQINDVSFYRNLIQRGIAEYFAYPIDITQMAKALRELPAHASKASKQIIAKNGFAVGFMSAASGDGASTVALNAAYILANKFNASVALVDLDYQFGMIARHLDLKAPYGIRELLEFPERGVDAALLNKMLVPYGKNLKVVAAPTDLRQLPDVRAEQIVELLNVLKSQFDFVFFDVQHIWVDWIASLMSKLDHNVLVAQLWLRSLTHVTRVLAAWQAQGIDNRNISLAVNRSGAKFKEAMTSEDFEHVSGKEIGFYLPNDTKSIVASENQGKTLIELGGSQLDKPLHQIAQHLYSLHTGEAPQIQEDIKKGVLQFLSKKA